MDREPLYAFCFVGGLLYAAVVGMLTAEAVNNDSVDLLPQ